MGKKYTPEQIINKLRKAEVLTAKGMTAQEAARQLGITEQTYYRWRKSYGGMRTDQAKRLKELEHENARLKKLAAEQALDLAILKAATEFASKTAVTFQKWLGAVSSSNDPTALESGFNQE